jgi:hypothetical protein
MTHSLTHASGSAEGMARQRNVLTVLHFGPAPVNYLHFCVHLTLI